MSLIAINDVYGDRHFVMREDYEGTRYKHLIPLYTSKGMKLSAFYERMGWDNKPVMIHRDNIKSIPQ